MSEFTAVPLEARSLAARRTSTRLGEARLFMSGLLSTALVVLAGTFFVAAALLIGVVGSPIIAAVVAYVALRQRRAARERVWVA